MRLEILVIMIFFGIPVWAQATEVSGLYETQVSVSSRVEAERAAGVQEALRQVLLKVAGNRQALARASLAPMLKEASKLVQQFRYDGVEEGSSAEILWVRFDPQGVDQLLRQQGLPVWGRMRPALLLWIGIEDGRRRYLLDASLSSPAAEILKEQARARGMSVVFPLWDLEDQSRLTFTDIWGNFSDPILAASSRYPASVPLVGRLLHRQTGDWQARWTLYGTGEVHGWDVHGEIEQVLREGIDEAVNTIAARVAPVAGNSTRFSVQLNVSEVASFMEYARLFSYLSNLSQVVDMQPVKLSRTEALFRLELQGDPKGLVASIQLDRVLSRTEKGAITEASTQDTPLNYRLLP